MPLSNDELNDLAIAMIGECLVGRCTCDVDERWCGAHRIPEGVDDPDDLTAVAEIACMLVSGAGDRSEVAEHAATIVEWFERDTPLGSADADRLAAKMRNTPIRQPPGEHHGC